MSYICFNLGRKGGSLRYAKNLLDSIEKEKLVISSLFSIEESPNNTYKIPTYNGYISFFLSSFTILPIVLMFLSTYLFFQVLLLRKKNIKLLFPYFQPWSVPIILISKLYNVKSISIVHDGVLHYGDGNKVDQFLRCRYVKASDGLIFLTSFVKKNVREKIGYHSKSIVIPHGIITSDVFEGPEKRVGRIKNKSLPNLLFFGRVSKYKGIGMLLNAMCKIDSSLYDTLRIVGKHQFNLEVSDELKEKVYVKDEYVSDADLANYFNISDILILPYLEATQSGVAMLGLSAQIPMIITNVGGLKEQFTEDEVIFCSPEVSDIKKSIEELILNEPKRLKMIDKLENKRKDLSWPNIAERAIHFSESL